MARIITNYGGLLLAAMGQTLLLALCGLFFACILGLVFGILSVLKNRACNIIATVFVDIIRGVPMIVLAFYVYFAVPMLLNNILHLNTMLGMKGQITFSALQAGTICLALNCGAYRQRSSVPVLKVWTKARWRQPAAWACPIGAPCTAWCCRRRSVR